MLLEDTAGEYAKRGMILCPNGWVKIQLLPYLATKGSGPSDTLKASNGAEYGATNWKDQPRPQSVSRLNST